MQVNETSSFLSSKKSFRKNIELIDKIKETIILLKKDKSDISLHHKKITCKKNKNRYSIKVLNTQYRILLNEFDEYIDLICVCSHDKYQRYNKNC